MARGAGLSNRQRRELKKTVKAQPQDRPGVVVLARVERREAVETEAQAEARAVRQGIEETLRLEAARSGELPKAAPAMGPVTAKFDGIGTLLEKGSLTKQEAADALAYRLAFNAGSGSLKSCLGNAGEGGGGAAHVEGLAPRSAQALRAAYLTARLGQIERAVMATDGKAAVDVLRLVAGEGRTLNSIGPSGGARAANLALLRLALATVGLCLRSPLRLANRGN